MFAAGSRCDMSLILLWSQLGYMIMILVSEFLRTRSVGAGYEKVKNNEAVFIGRCQFFKL